VVYICYRFSSLNCNRICICRSCILSLAVHGLQAANCSSRFDGSTSKLLKDFAYLDAHVLVFLSRPQPIGLCVDVQVFFLAFCILVFLPLILFLSCFCVFATFVCSPLVCPPSIYLGVKCVCGKLPPSSPGDWPMIAAQRKDGRETDFRKR
jgi:hypothetical protein